MNPQILPQNLLGKNIENINQRWFPEKCCENHIHRESSLSLQDGNLYFERKRLQEVLTEHT